MLVSYTMYFDKYHLLVCKVKPSFECTRAWFRVH